jgi:hypothetical protein
MNPEKLHRLLSDLHRELSGAASLDAESRRMVEQVLEDVRRLSPPPTEPAGEAHAAQLREAALRLEAEHPKLAAALGQVGDALAKLGI